MEEIRAGYDRVTSILERFSGYEGIDPEILRKAGERGTKVHKYCEAYAKEEWFPTPDEKIKPYVDSFIGWFDTMVEKVICLEERHYNDTYMITGAVDAILILKGDTEPTIVDYKTCQIMPRTAQLQTAAYMFLANKYKPKRRIALKLLKTGKPPKVVEYTDFHSDWILYKGILNAIRFFNKEA